MTTTTATNPRRINIMKYVIRTLTATLLALSALAFSPTASADDGCVVVDYQGAPATICPPTTPDLTNCYWGWFTGAPIEVCLPTGDTLPEGSTMADGSSPAYHVSASYVPPAITEVAPLPVIVEAAPAAVGAETVPVWLTQLLTLLAANGGGF